MPKRPRNPRLLLLVKQLFFEASQDARIGSKFTATKAVLLLDLAVEQFLNAVIAEFPSDAVMEFDGIKWRALWMAARDAAKRGGMEAGIPGHGQLRRLRLARTSASHYGLTPEPEEAAGFVPELEQVFSACFRDLFEIDFRSYRPTDELRDSAVRELLQRAEARLKEERGDDALADTHEAFDRTISKLGIPHERRWPLHVPTPDIATGGRSSAEMRAFAGIVESALKQVTESIDGRMRQLAEDQALASLGISLASTARYRATRKLVQVQYTAAGTRRAYGSASKSDYLQAAPLALDYVSNLALIVEAAE